MDNITSRPRFCSKKYGSFSFEADNEIIRWGYRDCTQVVGSVVLSDLAWICVMNEYDSTDEFLVFITKYGDEVMVPHFGQEHIFCEWCTEIYPNIRIERNPQLLPRGYRARLRKLETNVLRSMLASGSDYLPQALLAIDAELRNRD